MGVDVPVEVSKSPISKNDLRHHPALSMCSPSSHDHGDTMVQFLGDLVAEIWDEWYSGVSPGSFSRFEQLSAPKQRS